MFQQKLQPSSGKIHIIKSFCLDKHPAPPKKCLHLHVPQAMFLEQKFRSSWKLGLEAKPPSAMPVIDLTSWAWQPLPVQVAEGLAGFEGND